jgi:hypothetical protein
LLDLSSLHGYFCDAEAWIIFDSKRIKFSRVESPGDSIESMGYGVESGTLLRRSEASSGTRALHPNEMPTRAPNHRIKYGRLDLFKLRPILTERRSHGIYAIRQGAIVTKENGMQRHALALFDCPDGVIADAIFGPFGLGVSTGVSTKSVAF